MRAPFTLMLCLAVPVAAAAQVRPEGDEWLKKPVDDRTFRTFLTFFAYDHQQPLDVKVASTQDVDGIKAEAVSYLSGPGARVTARITSGPAAGRGGPGIVLIHGGGPPGKDSPALRLGTGLVSGVLNGLAAIGGMAVAVMLFATTITGAAARATLVALFFATDLYSLAWAGWHGLLDSKLLIWAAWLTVPMLIGIWIGSRHFLKVDEAHFRRGVLWVLASIAALGLINGVRHH